MPLFLLTAKPTFLVQPESIVAGQGDRVIMHCKVHGRPQPLIQWFHNGVPIADSHVVGGIVRFSNGSLLFPEVTRAFTGNYACNASNSLGYAFKNVFLMARGE
jgi:hypothetical protein